MGILLFCFRALKKKAAVDLIELGCGQRHVKMCARTALIAATRGPVSMLRWLRGSIFGTGDEMMQATVGSSFIQSL